MKHVSFLAFSVTRVEVALIRHLRRVDVSLERPWIMKKRMLKGVSVAVLTLAIVAAANARKYASRC